nr:unnamed protein product [Callosobruchus analis]
MSIQPNDSRVVEFSDYLVENYIEAMFPPKICCTSPITRTTNCCESFHSKLNECSYKTHPSLCIPNNFQTEAYIKIKSVQAPVRCKDPKTKRRQASRKQKIDEYRRNKIEILQFV